jgi:trimethylamine--corrinoid protein Co-methyltransferase
MAPITILGALVQQHAEALFGIVLAQLARRGAPVVYGGFTSNVDMKSGAPAFGTPEFVKAAWASGQLARHIGLPWRSSNVNASNVPDAQAAYESQMSMWGALMGGSNIVLHGAGWLEGGLSASKEKFVIDVEMLQMFAELFRPVDAAADELGLEAIREVGPGGHFFAAAHTMARYRSAFYRPLVSDWSNFGQWTENGARDATRRARDIAEKMLAEFEPPSLDPAIRDELEAFKLRRISEGGAPPEP